jgi:hypothetical protein
MREVPAIPSAREAGRVRVEARMTSFSRNKSVMIALLPDFVQLYCLPCDPRCPQLGSSANS